MTGVVSEVLTRADILGACDLPSERVHVRAWGGKKAIVRAMSARLRARFDSLVKIDMPIDEAEALLLVHCLVDESGRPLFEPEDAPALREKHPLVVRELATIAMRLNKMTTAAREDLLGNSGGEVPSGDSSSSPSASPAGP